MSNVWETLFMPYANNKGADQPAHPRSLIRAFVVRCLDSIMPLVSISEISSLYLAYNGWAVRFVSIIWSQSPKTGFLDVAQMQLIKYLQRNGVTCKFKGDMREKSD